VQLDLPSIPQVPVPDALEAPTGSGGTSGEQGGSVAPDELLGQACGQCPPPKLELAQKIASRMRDKAYTLRMYHDDLVDAFPELRLYAIREPAVKQRRMSAYSAKRMEKMTTSGISSCDEYLRTIGAFFSVCTRDTAARTHEHHRAWVA
jgi:hypothetical protein